MGLRHFHFAGEEGGVAFGQLVPHLDDEVNRTCIGDALVFRNVSRAALSLPPAACLYLVGLAIDFHPRSFARKSEFNVKLAAAGDWSIDSISDPRHPTPDVVVLLVNVEGESGDLDRVFGNRRLFT